MAEPLARYVLESVNEEQDSEDGGCARILQVWKNPDGTTSKRLFARIQSWDEPTDASVDPAHPEMDGMKGKRVRVTIEVFD